MPTPQPFEFALTSFLSESMDTTQIYPLIVPKSERVNLNLPRIVYTPVSGKHTPKLSGASGFMVKTIQIDVYSSRRDEVLAVQEDIRMALQDYTGLMGSWWVHNVTPVELPNAVKMKEDSAWNDRVEYRFLISVDVPIR